MEEVNDNLTDSNSFRILRIPVCSLNSDLGPDYQGRDNEKGTIVETVQFCLDVGYYPMLGISLRTDTTWKGDRSGETGWSARRCWVGELFEG